MPACHFCSIGLAAGPQGGPGPLTIIALIAVGLAAIVLRAAIGANLSLYIQALLSRAGVQLWDIAAMRMRRVDVREVVYARIRVCKAGLDVPLRALETHALAGGNVGRVVSAMIVAKGGRIDLSWGVATAVDLAGGNILNAVQETAAAGGRSMRLAESLPDTSIPASE